MSRMRDHSGMHEPLAQPGSTFRTMTRSESNLQLMAAILCGVSAGCAFQTTPLFQPGSDAGHATLGATKAPDAHVPSEGPPVQLDAGFGSTGSAAPASSDAAALPPTSTITSPEAGTPVGATQTITPTSTAGNVAPPPPPDRCDGAGRYALKLSLDVAWDSTASVIEAGRGRADLYALLNVEHVDPQTHAVSASARVCGLDLPAFETAGGCASYQFRFDDALWDRSALPELQLSGTYACDTTNCNLQFDPASYAVGLHLDDPSAPLPDAGVTTGLQFPDDDGDGQPGVTVDVVTQASTQMGDSECSYPSAWMQPTAPATTPTMNQAQMPTWRSMLGARTQLMAAVGLGADCRVDRASGAVEELDLRAAGCGYQPGSDPNSANQMCAEEWRGAIDQSMPQYHVLAAGQTPGPSMTMRDGAPSLGTVAQAVKLDPGAMAGCREVRATMFRP